MKNDEANRAIDSRIHKIVIVAHLTLELVVSISYAFIF